MNNGGCDVNAICSHTPKTNAPKCTCKTGYTNVGCTCNIICKGIVQSDKNHYGINLKYLSMFLSLKIVAQVNNGGCEVNAICSHDKTTNDVKCTCKTGYTNTGSQTNINCTGMIRLLTYCVKTE